MTEMYQIFHRNVKKLLEKGTNCTIPPMLDWLPISDNKPLCENETEYSKTSYVINSIKHSKLLTISMLGMSYGML